MSFNGVSSINEGEEHQKKQEEGEREEEDEAKKKHKVSFLKLFHFADLFDYVLMGIGSVGACVHGVSVPVFFIFFGKLINVMGQAYIFPDSVSDKVAKYSLDFVYLGVVVLFSSWAEVACWMYTGERQTTKMRLVYVRAVMNQDISVFDTTMSTGEVIATITGDIIVVQDAISEKVGNFMHHLSRFVAGFAIGFAQVWQISLVILSMVPLIAIVGGVYAFVGTGLTVRLRKSYVRAGEIAEEVIGNIRTVQAFVGEEKAVKAYRNALLKTYDYGKKAGVAKGLGLGSMHAVLFCSLALLVWFASIIVHKNVANGGESFTTMFNVLISAVALGQGAPNISTFIRAKVAAYPVLQMIENNTKNSKTTAKTSHNIPNKVLGHIQLNNICFSYPSRPNVMILNKLCLDIPAAKTVALVGGSGSGKSTVISLIERFYEPNSGEILLDGNNIRDLDIKWLRHQIGLVNQEPALFATSIRENILYGKDDATMDDITQAAKISEAYNFIKKFPDRYETQVGERGIQLSGGQKQRIAITRAVLKSPSILLLDEATSALDAESEKLVQLALDRIMVGRTTIVVAHRLSTVMNADVIAVVQGGRIVEIGSHGQLISDESSAYSNLVRLQEGDSATDPAMGPQLQPSTRCSSRESSLRITSFGSSVYSDREFASHVIADDEDAILKPIKHVSLRRLYKLVSPDIIYGAFGIIGAILAGALMPFFALGISEALVSYYMDWDTTRREIKEIALLFCGGAVLSIIFSTIEYTSFGILGERLTLRLREMMLTAILKNEIEWFDSSGNASSMLSACLEADVTLLKTIVADRSTIVLQSISLAINAFAIAFVVNWRIALVVLCTFPFLVGGQISEKLFMQGFGGNLSKAYLKANMLAGEAVSNIRTIASFCSEEKVIEHYARELTEPSKRSFRRGQIAGIFYGLSQFFLFASYGLALWYGSILMHKELSSFKSIIKSFMVLTIAALEIGETLALAPDYIKGTQMVASVFEILDRKTKMVGDVGEELQRVKGMIDIRGIEFSYPSRPNALIFKDFNLEVKAGKSMALVGSSGAGKSTVLALILRYYDPGAGVVMIDGKDIKKLKLKSLRKCIGLVQQEPPLFSTSIYENILYGKDEASESEVIEAAKLANAHTFISGLPEGYSTKVGERGVQLSGGQKQRVAIARAILKNPAILLLDEATSALDAESELIIQQALEILMKNRTTVIVAHRLSTIKNADEISVLKNGKIIQQGSHSALVENRNGAYYKLTTSLYKNGSNTRGEQL